MKTMVKNELFVFSQTRYAIGEFGHLFKTFLDELLTEMHQTRDI